MKETDEPVIKEVCASCGAKLKGNYCRKCGEKKIVPERDFSFRKFLSQTLWHFARFDSKLLKSVWLLISKPGFLTAEWINGRRVGYMKPLQLFVAASVLFYFFLPTTAAHYTGPRDLIVGYQEHHYMMNIFQYDFGKIMAEKELSTGMDETALGDQIMETAAHRSKTWLFLIIPVWGTLIFLFFKKQMPWLAPNLIFAMHALTFYILFDLGLHPMFYLMGLERQGRYIFLLLSFSFPVYQALAARRVYGNTWPVTILKTIGIALGFITIILIYRQVVTISTLIV